jgi:peptidoglycan hydrolase CwlO-like protein
MDYETKEMFNLIINKLDKLDSKVGNLETKIDNLEVKVDALQVDVDQLKKDVSELKINVKANYKELLTLGERTTDIQNKLFAMEQVTARNLYDLTVMKQRKA